MRQLDSSPLKGSPRALIIIRDLLNTLVLLGSLLVIVALSFEVLYDLQGEYQQTYLKIQLWVCIVFLADFFFRLYLSKEKGRFVRRNFIFFLVSLPLVNLSVACGWDRTPELNFLLRLLPLVRGGYGLSLVVSWFARNKINNLLYTYLVSTLAFAYFASLVFYSLEKPINAGVHGFDDALSWAFMNMTTVGSNIIAVTQVGKLLAVLLAAAGMMIFPIFTVYFTDRFSNRKRSMEEQTGREGDPVPSPSQVEEEGQ